MKLRETIQPTNPRRVCNLPGHAHFLTWCTHRRQAGLTLPPFNRWIVESLNRAVEIHGYGMVAWVIMPEHLHVIVRPREAEYSISKFLQSAKQSVTRRAMKGYRLGELHPSQNWVCSKSGESPEFRLWQRGGGFDFNIYDPATMREKIEYIHHNPVRRELVELVNQWEWSSYQDLMEHRQPWLPLDRKWG